MRLAGALGRHADTLLVLPDKEAAPYRHLLDQAVRLRPFRKPRLRQAWRQVQTVALLIREIDQFRPDLIHLQSGHLWFNCALPWLRRHPLVLTVHDPSRHPGDRGGANTPQWIMDLGYHRAAQLIVHAPQLKQALIERLHLRGDNVHVVPMVLCGDDRAQERECEDGATILFFGRIWPYKGLEYLIRAEPLITAQVPEVKIVIAGEGEDCDRYRRMMVHPERFVLHNEYVSDEHRAELFRRSSVVVLPYTEASQSGVIPLAYRFGKPVVATTVGGLPALVEDGQTGFLVPPGDEKALAAALVRLLQNQELRLQLGGNARRKVNAECAPEVVASRTLAIYEKAIDNGG